MNIIDQLDEPKKPLIPLFVANWLDDCKNNKVSLVDSMNPTFMKTKNQSKETIEWISCYQEKFAQAWVYDYVIKEKRYTAKYKKTGEYLRLDNESDFGHFYVDRDYIILSGNTAYQFTESQLHKYNILENGCYEIEEVKYDD